jgi:hypothetical protein
MASLFAANAAVVLLKIKTSEVVVACAECAAMMVFGFVPPLAVPLASNVSY